MPRKPDQFDEIVARNCIGKGENKFLYASDVAVLLRKEHRWVERLITKEKRDLTLLAHKTRQSNDPRDIALADCLDARVHQCDEFIRWLQQRRK